VQAWEGAKCFSLISPDTGLNIKPKDMNYGGWFRPVLIFIQQNLLMRPLCIAPIFMETAMKDETLFGVWSARVPMALIEVPNIFTIESILS